MSKRYIIVGGVAGGASAAMRLRRIDEHAEIQIYDMGPDVSFSNCCLPNYFSNEVPDISKLVFNTPASFKAKFNIDAKLESEVIAIHPEEHSISIRDLKTQEVYKDHYDALILSPGVHAKRPASIKGIDMPHIFSIKNVQDIRDLDRHLAKNEVQDVAIMGGGFIGIEMAECLRKSGKRVTVIQSRDQILRTYDEDMVQILHKELYDNEVKLILQDRVSEIQKDRVILTSGKTVKAQAVILSIGVEPAVDFAVKSGVKLGETGGILVDHNYQTNLPDVYAIGDAIETFHSMSGQKIRLPFAGPAQKQARSLANYLNGEQIRNTGVIGSSCIRVFSRNAAATGLNERMCQEQGIDYRMTYIIPMSHVGLMPDSAPMHFKLIFEYPSGKILGAQAISKNNPIKNINVIATAIKFGATLADLEDLELCYTPAYSTPKDVVNYAAIVGSNILHGAYQQISMSKVRELVASKSFILDVRDERSYQQSHIKGAINIPFAQIRKRHTELPKDQMIYVHCRTSWSSYHVCKTLMALGYKVINIQGSFLGLSYYEYYRDMTTDREPILTGYIFD